MLSELTESAEDVRVAEDKMTRMKCFVCQRNNLSINFEPKKRLKNWRFGGEV